MVELNPTITENIMDKDSLIHLKVKIKSLAAESKIIRLEERRAKAAGRRALRASLQDHRLHVVRSEARHSQLAYAFLRNRELVSIERQGSSRPNWDSVRKMVERFSGAHKELEKVDIKVRLEMWREGHPGAASQ